MFYTLRKKQLAKNAILVACLASPLCIRAQTQADSLSKMKDSLQTVTVTATRSGKDVMDVGRSTTVITADQIKQQGYTTIADVLSQQEGIFIMGTGQNPGALQNIFLRGADENHTTVMIDGIPINDPSSTDAAIDLSELSIADVDRIEIVRGSHSTLYGSSAMGGVINIITTNSYSPGVHANISATGGEFGTGTQLFDENLMLNYTLKNGFYAEGGYHRLDDIGISSAVDTLKNPLPYQQNIRNNIDRGDVFAKAGYKDKKLLAYIEYRNTNKSYSIPDGAFMPANNYNVSFVRDFYEGFIRYKFTPDFQLQYRGSYSPMHRLYRQDTTLMYNYGYYKSFNSGYFTSNTIINEVQASYKYKTSEFIIGGGMNYETMNTLTQYWSGSTSDSTEYSYSTSLDSLKPHQTIADAYAQADLNGATFLPALRSLSLLMGLRFSSISSFGNNVSYEINPSFRLNKNTMFYLSYSTGFNAPSLYQLYGPNDLLGDQISLGNPNLSPETSVSYEVGVKRKTGKTFFTLAYFNTVVTNDINYVYVWNKNKPVDSLTYADFLGDTYLNVGKETTQGIELSITSQLDPKLSISGNISILSSNLEYSGAGLDTTHTHGNTVQIFNGGSFLTNTSGNITLNGLLRRPGDMANITLTYKPISKLSFSGVLRYVGVRTDATFNPALGPYGADAAANIPDYMLVNLYASYEIMKGLKITASCENLLNTTYYEIFGYSTLGRAFYLNFRYNL